MTRLLEKAFEEAPELPEEEQDDFAAFLLEELDSERRSGQTFGTSQDELGRLADDALEEHDAGDSETLDPSQL